MFRSSNLLPLALLAISLADAAPVMQIREPSPAISLPFVRSLNLTTHGNINSRLIDVDRARAQHLVAQGKLRAQAATKRAHTIHTTHTTHTTHKPTSTSSSYIIEYDVEEEETIPEYDGLGLGLELDLKKKKREIVYEEDEPYYDGLDLGLDLDLKKREIVFEDDDEPEYDGLDLGLDLDMKKRASTIQITNTAVTYIATVGIGSPPTQYTLLIDTGSSNTWVGADQLYTKTKAATNTGGKVHVSYGSGSFDGDECKSDPTYPRPPSLKFRLSSRHRHGDAVALTLRHRPVDRHLFVCLRLLRY